MWHSGKACVEWVEPKANITQHIELNCFDGFRCALPIYVELIDRSTTFVNAQIVLMDVPVFQDANGHNRMWPEDFIRRGRVL